MVFPVVAYITFVSFDRLISQLLFIFLNLSSYFATALMIIKKLSFEIDTETHVWKH